MEKQKVLLKGHVVSPQGVSSGKDLVEIAGGIITEVGETGSFYPGPDHQIFDFGPNYICPGFVDLHVHGAGGADVMDATPDALQKMAAALARGGTTTFLATTMSAAKNDLLEVIHKIAAAKGRISGGARIAGIHLEGPFINPEKKGAHSGAYIRPADINELRTYIDAAEGAIRMVTLAPGMPGALDLIRYAASRGFIVSLGHSAASITQVYEACAAGLSHVSHAFNAMTGLHHRDPGTAGAIMSIKELSVDIIADGHHVHPSVIKIAVLVKGLDRVCAITDCMRAGQMGDGQYELGGQPVTVKNGLAHLADGTIAGSTISMADGFRVLVEKVGLTIPEAVQLTAANPAGLLGLDTKGVLVPGKDADIVVLDHDFNVLMTMVGGTVVYKA